MTIEHLIAIELALIVIILMVFLFRLLGEELGLYPYKEEKNKDSFDKFD